MTQQARSDVEESKETIKDFNQQMVELQARREEVIAEINDRWGRVVNEITEVTIAPKKTDVLVNVFGVAWLPHYVIKSGAETFELPAFGEQ
jgi:predicted transcriptional regulator